MKRCDLCDSTYRNDAYNFRAQKAELYGITVCNNCWRLNWEGWNQKHEKRLLSILAEKRLPIPDRNGKELLPRV